MLFFHKCILHICLFTHLLWGNTRQTFLNLVIQGFEVGSHAAIPEEEGRKRAIHGANMAKTRDHVSTTVFAMDVKHIKASGYCGVYVSKIIMDTATLQKRRF